MKVLHLLQSARFSGAENVVFQIFGMFKDASDMQMAYCSRDGQIREALKKREIEFYPIKEVSVKEVKRVIKEYKPDIIHAHDMFASFTASMACGKTPLISHIHNNAFDSRGLSIKSIAYIFAAIKANHIFWVSDSSFNGYCFHSLFQRKSSILYNCIDVNALYDEMNKDKKQYDFDIIFLGRLSEPKNPLRVLDVIELIVKSNSRIKVAMVGAGELENIVEQKIIEKRLEKNITMFVFVSNHYKMLYNSKLMLMTSKWEGLPMCALEAMALGVPIVSTPTDGLNKIVCNNITGYLTNDNSQLASYCLDIISDHNLRVKLSNSSKKQAQQLLNINQYREILKKTYLKCLMIA